MMIPLIAGPGMGGILEEIIPKWVTPGAARDEQESVNTAVASLDSDVRASMAPVAFKVSWEAFRAEWAAFFDDQGGVMGWLDRFATARAYEKTLDYRKQLEAWRARFMEAGGAPSGPGLVPKPKTDESASQALKYVAITAVALGAVYVVSKLGVLGSLVPRTNPRRRNPRRRRR